VVALWEAMKDARYLTLAKQLAARRAGGSDDDISPLTWNGGGDSP
jgi:hypothetical protein